MVRHLSSWMIQLLAAGTLPFLVCSLALTYKNFSIPENLATAIGYIFFPASGIGLALAISRIFPMSYREGIWVWVLPGGGFLGLGFWNSPLYLLTHPLATVMITFPVLSCCCYSATMYWHRRKLFRQAPFQPEPGESETAPADPDSRDHPG